MGDAPPLGGGGSNPVEVRLLSPTPTPKPRQLAGFSIGLTRPTY